MRAVSVRCPHCGAVLDARDDASSVTCAYCGTVARVQPRSRVWQVPTRLPAWTEGQPRPVARQRVAAIGCLSALLVLGAVTAGVVVLVTKAGVTLGPDRGRMGWWGNTPVLADVDGDGGEDLIGFSRYVLDGDRMHVAAFSGVTGQKLWETPRLGSYTDVYQGVLAAAGDRVLLATPSGSLRAFDRATGADRWETQLGEKVDELCAGDAGDQGAIVVGTADQRWHRVALADGGRTDAPARAEPERRVGAMRRVRGARDPRWCEPLSTSERKGMPGLVVAEGPWAELPPVEGMRLERVVRRGDGPMVVIGTKQPGSAVPMIAVLDDAGAVVWKAVVAAHDPLNSRVEDHLVTVSDDTVFVIYLGNGGNDTPQITAFALADGRRRWDVAVARGTTIVMTALALAGKDVVVLSSWGHLQAFDRATGAARFRIGQL